ncbi:hypothetical protein VNO77_20347 [Canavalia gladiata]|uniref:Uncharacterized protein n=1 Tax=Canavalia gladiata TaxID=3824 RepID=A0AAN9LTD9_CANGL
MRGKSGADEEVVVTYTCSLLLDFNKNLVNLIYGYAFRLVLGIERGTQLDKGVDCQSGFRLAARRRLAMNWGCLDECGGGSHTDWRSRAARENGGAHGCGSDGATALEAECAMHWHAHNIAFQNNYIV